MRLPFKILQGVSKAKAAPRLTKAQAQAQAQERAVRAVNAINATSGAARTEAVEKAAEALRAYRATGGTIHYDFKTAPVVKRAVQAPGEVEWPEDLAAEVARHGRA